jgi:hypothetical protein
MGYKHASNGAVLLEEKSEIKKRLGASPDLADRVALCFADGPPGHKNRAKQVAELESQNRIPVDGSGVMEIKHCVVITANPTSSNDTGSAEEGWFTVSDGLVTMTDKDGDPIRNANGDRMTHKLLPGENPVVIAGRMRLKMWRDERGDGVEGFNRRIDYGSSGVV